MADRYATQNLNTTLTAFGAETFRNLPGVADILAPVVSVPTTTGKYYVFNETESARDDYDAIRAPKTESQEISRSYTSATYSAQQYMLKELVADEEYDNADRAVIDPEQDAAGLIMSKIRLGREIRVCTLLMTSGNYGSNTAGATAIWNHATAASVKIELDCDTAQLAVEKSCGQTPNTIVIPPHIAKAAKRDSTIRDLIKYTDPTLLVNGDLPPTLFGMRVVIPKMVKDSADPGVSTASKGFAWADNSVAVLYIDPVNSKRSLSFCKTFRRPLGGQLDVAMYRYRNDDKHANVVEGGIEEVLAVTASGAGYLITTAYT